MLRPHCGKVNLDRNPSDWLGLRAHFRGLLMQPSYRPRNKKRIAKHGFRARMETRWGRETLSRRRKKGRKQLTVRTGSKDGSR